MKQLISKNILGDMQILYVLDSERNIAGMCIAPHDMDIKESSSRVINVQSLAECKIIGCDYPGNYFGGLSIKYSACELHYSKQSIHSDENGTEIVTYLKSDFGLDAKHIVSYKTGTEYLRVSTEFSNASDRQMTLEMISSFAIYGISPFLDLSGADSMVLHRLRSKWSMEGRLVSEPFEDLLLEDCWCYGNSFNVRFGQVGSMPVKDYFPFAAVEDIKNNVLWGAQLGCPSSWQMEITRGDDCVCMSGGPADREFGHWMKTLEPGESFTAVPVVLSVCKGNIDDISRRLVSAQEENLSVPKSEEELPIIFNEYCTTWGCPSHENISAILNAIDGKGIDYFVIDCGWYKSEGVPWYCSMGDYEPSKELFPNGIEKTVSLIKSHGMRPGIWFEFENVGKCANAYSMTDHMLKRDGLPLTTLNRRFWDMNDPWVENYLDEHVIGFLKRCGFGYMKVDYNETIGIGCDNPDGLGEGLRQNMNATVEYFKKIRRELPDLVLENCASGGHRLEPTFMSLCSMASFSDAHECVEIPIIAANLHRAILPRQSQIWCVIRKSDTPQRIAYSIAATFLGRMCFSGDVTELSDEQWSVIESGIEFYKSAVPFIKSGRSSIYGERTKSDRHPKGYQAVLRKNNEGALLVVHTFENSPEEICIPLDGDYEIAKTFSHNEFFVSLENGYIRINTGGDFIGIGIILK